MMRLVSNRSTSRHFAERAPLITAALFVLMAGSLIAQDARPAPLAESIRSDWAMDAMWDEGHAEVATYDGEQVVDGAPRRHAMIVVTVKEDLNREYNVKADWPHGQKPILAAMKQMQIATIPATDYPRHLMATLFVERENPGKLVKMTISSQEWSGITSKEFDFSRRTPQWHWSSYRDGEGSGSETLRGWPQEAIFEEHLPLLVRTLDLHEGLDASLALVPNQSTNRAPRPEPVSARLRVERPDAEVRVPAGTWATSESWRVSIEAGDGRAMEFVVVDDPTRVLLAWSSNDGRFFALRSMERRAPGQIPEQVVDE